MIKTFVAPIPCLRLAQRKSGEVIITNANSFAIIFSAHKKRRAESGQGKPGLNEGQKPYGAQKLPR
jgi:hypothetical protein